MGGYGWAPLAWIVVAVGCWPYADRVRHPSIAHATAWLVLVATFSAMAPVIFGLLTALVFAAYPTWITESPPVAFAVPLAFALLARPFGAVAVLGLAFMPGLLLGSWLISRPLRRMPLPGE